MAEVLQKHKDRRVSLEAVDAALSVVPELDGWHKNGELGWTIEDSLVLEQLQGRGLTEDEARMVLSRHLEHGRLDRGLGNLLIATAKMEYWAGKADTSTNGPTLNGFCWQGVFYKGMKPTAWKLVSYLWGRDRHTASFVDLAGPVWDHSVIVGVDRVRSARREANRFFVSNEILFEIKVDARLNTVELAEIKSS